eukprot:scaffold71857_cov54-Attheya_sp.AAC.1
MSSAALGFGCAFLAFSPMITLLLLLSYQKAQLIIVVTTSAFAFLLSALCSSLIWLAVPSSLSDNAPLLIIPSVIFQAAFRCGFVAVYHRVEKVILTSIHNHERHAAAENAAGNNGVTMNESAQLRLELNDVSCGLAAGTGFGGMHAIMLYGTLLASEQRSLGTLYQPGCSFMPSLVNSALMAFLFSLLDIVLMLFTFYGMRRRLQNEESHSLNFGWGTLIGDSKQGGLTAIGITVIAHLGAAFATVPNRADDGCLVALPLLFGIVVITAVVFMGGVSSHYLPVEQQRRMESRQNTTAEGNVSHQD